jgi:carboxyl-terminal processing protease
MDLRTTKAARLQNGLLLIGILLLCVCAYLVATIDQRVRATEKIKDGKVGKETGAKVAGKDFSEKYQRFSEVMAEVIVHVQDNYVEDVDPDRIFKAALNGVFEALDTHSSYLTSENFQKLEQSIEADFSGIGVHINLDQNGLLTVISPIPGSPAARVGLRAWDRIIEIEGESTEGLSSSEAVKRLTGPTGTKVNITIFRPSTKERLPFSIVRNRIKIESVYSNVDDGDYVTPYFKYLLENHIGYIRLTQFNETIAEDLEKVLDKMGAQKVQGVILDLRFNSGGLLNESIDVSSLFLKKGQMIVATKGRLKEQNKEYVSQRDQKVDWPMIVLVNEATASASEILAGALQDHKRAILVGPEGKNTYGKGLVQTITPMRVSLEQDANSNDLPNAIRLTTAKYYTPNNAGPDGKSMHLVGIEPDVHVEVSDAQYEKLLTKGLMLGDPVMVESDKDKEKSAAAKPEGETSKDAKPETPAPGDTKTEKPADSKETETKKENAPDKETKDSQNTSLKSEDEGAGLDEKLLKPAETEEDESVPFYMRKKRQPAKKHPVTEDVQLRYSVDLMHGLLFSNSNGHDDKK